MLKEKELEFVRCHPVVLLLYVGGSLMATMLTMHPFFLFVSFFSAVVYCIFLNGTKCWKSMFVQGMLLLFFGVCVLPFFQHNGVTPLFYVNGLAITLESVRYGCMMAVLLFTVLLWFQIWNRLLDSEKFLYLFGRFLPSVGLLLSMVFRMLPLMRYRYREIADAQKGLRPGEKKTGIGGKLQKFGKEVSVLISWSLEHSMETAISMEARGYGSGKRSSFQIFVFTARDGILCVLLAVCYGVTLFCILVQGASCHYFPEFQFENGSMATYIGLFMFGIGALLPFFYDMMLGAKGILHP